MTTPTQVTVKISMYFSDTKETIEMTPCYLGPGDSMTLNNATYEQCLEYRKAVKRRDCDTVT